MAAAETAYAGGVAQESAELKAATSLGTFATAMNNTPWATYRADRAVAERDRWAAQAPNYLTRFADRAVPQSTYQSAATTAAGARTTAQNSADQAGVADVAGAVETRSGDVSTAYKDYATMHAVAVEDYRTAVAQAERNRTVALAQAQAALDSGGSQSDYDTAAAAAESAYAGAMKTAADDYAVSEAGERGTRDVAVASAGAAFATAAGTAEVTWVTATFTAEETFVGAEGAAHATRVAELANLDAAYLSQEASSYTAAYDALDTASDTPWSTRDADHAAAGGAWLTTVALEEAILAIARVNADRDLDLARATAEKDLAIALVQASSDEWLALVTADLVQVTAESSANQALAATAGWTGLLRVANTELSPDTGTQSTPGEFTAPDLGGGTEETLEWLVLLEDFTPPEKPVGDEEYAKNFQATVDTVEKAKGKESIGSGQRGYDDADVESLEGGDANVIVCRCADDFTYVLKVKVEVLGLKEFPTTAADQGGIEDARQEAAESYVPDNQYERAAADKTMFVSFQERGGTDESDVPITEERPATSFPEKADKMCVRWWFDGNGKCHMRLLYYRGNKLVHRSTVYHVIGVKWNPVDGQDGYAYYDESGTGSGPPGKEPPHSIPTNSLGTEQLRKNFQQIDDKLGDAAIFCGVKALQGAVFVFPDPSDLVYLIALAAQDAPNGTIQVIGGHLETVAGVAGGTIIVGMIGRQGARRLARTAGDAASTAPNVVAKSPLVARIQGKLNLYPKVIDARTGRNIQFPSGIVDRVPKAQRVAWTRQDRAGFIAEWHRRGYARPNGGWDKYDIHHIQPREFGGTNDFWNLVPVERGTHQSLFNSFWREFLEL